MDVLPTTSRARFGLLLEGAGVLVYALFLVNLEAGWVGRDLPPIAGWGLPVLAVLVGAVLVLIGILRHGERSLLGWVGLAPGAFFLLLQVAEITGLME